MGTLRPGRCGWEGFLVLAIRAGLTINFVSPYLYVLKHLSVVVLAVAGLCRRMIPFGGPLSASYFFVPLVLMILLWRPFAF